MNQNNLEEYIDITDDRAPAKTKRRLNNGTSKRDREPPSEDEIKQLKLINAHLTTQINILQNQKVHNTSTLDAVNIERCSFKEKEEQFKKVILEKNHIINKKNNIIDKLQFNEKMQKQNMQKLKEQLCNYQQQLIKKDEEIAQQEVTISNLNEKINKYKNKKDTYKAQVNDLQTQMNNIKGKNNKKK